MGSFYLALSILVSFGAVVANAAFCYDDTLPCGPSNWDGICIRGNAGRQSPINIHATPALLLSNSRDQFTMSPRYKQAFNSFGIQNNGHSIEITVSDADSKGMTISYNGTLKYQFAQMHFHWGKDNRRGSEHTVNGGSYPLEAHLVHFNTKYPTFAAAAAATTDPMAISVIGVFVDICPPNQPTFFEQIAQLLKTAAAHPTDTAVQVNSPMKLNNILPPTLNHFSYSGSLTTPGCAELVHWNVLQRPVCIKDSELALFRKITDHEGQALTTNHRPVQPLGNRKVLFHRA